MRYIGSIQKQNGMLVISGVIGVRRYLWYSKREAIVRYNQECRKSYSRSIRRLTECLDLRKEMPSRSSPRSPSSTEIPALSPATATDSIGRFAGSF